MRCFVALPMPDPAVKGITTLQGHLRAGRAVPAENLHLTLAFLGDVRPEALEEMHGALEMVAFRPIELRLSGLDAVGGARPNVLFARAQGGEGLGDLHRAVARAARGAGIVLARERFMPHVTIARFPRGMVEAEAAKLGAFLQAWGDWALAPVLVPGFALYRSDLRAEGARYEVLAEYPGPLAGRGWSA